MSRRTRNKFNPLGASGRSVPSPGGTKKIVPGQYLKRAEAANQLKYVKGLLVESDDLAGIAKELNAQWWSFDGLPWTEEKLKAIRKKHLKR